MKLYIKNMVSLRCELLVKKELDLIGLRYTNIELGSVDIADAISEQVRLELKQKLGLSGLELLDDERSATVEKIKALIIEMIHYADEVPKVNYSDFISEKLNCDYVYLSKLFSEVKGITIQHFITLHKIEKVKELILYDDLSLTEIAFRLNYSSVNHLSNQFKKVTGKRPLFYKNLKEKRKGNINKAK